MPQIRIAIRAGDPATMLELNRELIKMGGKPARLALRDFTIWPK